jgi:hypothetical protein
MSWRKPNIPRRAAAEAFEQQAQQNQQQQEDLSRGIIYHLSHMRGGDNMNRELAEFLHFEGEQEIAREHAAARAHFRSILRRRGNIIENRQNRPLTATENRLMLTDLSTTSVRQAGHRLQRAARRASVSKVQRKEKLKKFKPPAITRDLRPPGPGRRGPPPPPPPTGGAIRIPV